MIIPFIKAHGLGNDFVILEQDIVPQDKFKDFVIRISDRRIGIGCDQLILYQQQSDNTYIMKIFNPDGSYAAACGNATRCLAKILNVQNLNIVVDGRILHTSVQDNGLVKVNMGQCKFLPIENDLLINVINSYQLNIKETFYINVGNDHLVVFYNSLSMKEKDNIGFKMQKIFPDGVNVNFANLQPDGIHLDVWERGVGFTLACGSGACATFAAAHKLGFVDNFIDIKFKLGDLRMNYNDNNDVIMTGPANISANGNYYHE